jgi:hypothetical protein
MRFPFVVPIIFALTVGSAPAFGCKCAPPPPALKTARELAEWNAKGAEAIFEGKVERVELKSSLAEGRIGDVIPATVEEDPPVMQVSFQVSRAYRGAPQKHLKLKTGLGGGDCGFDFEVGKRYLVYASTDDAGQLSTGICTGTALLEESHGNLGYLRGDPVISDVSEKKVAIETGRLCGQLVLDNSIRSTDGQVLLFRAGNKSPIPSDEAEPENDGSFCVTVVPGKYFLLFKDGSEESPKLFAFFPGVTKMSEATAINIEPGQTVSHLLFKVPVQRTYSVSGKISTFNKSQLKADPKAILVSADQSFALAYAEDVAPDGAFIFRHVLAGKYWAVVTVDSDGTTKWSTRKVAVDVDGNVTDLSLELIAN